MQRHEPVYSIREIPGDHDRLRGRLKPLRDNEGQIVKLPRPDAQRIARDLYGPMWREKVALEVERDGC